MLTRCLLVIGLALVGAPVGAHAQSAPQISAEDRALALDDAFARLRSAPTAGDAAAIEANIWRLWSTGSTPEATERLAEAIAAIRGGAAGRAKTRLDALIADRPAFAEAWNQRAFALFLLGDLDASLVDIAETLSREPRHFGALSGRARIEARQGRARKARLTMGEVGAVHPWMARRSAISPEPPVGPPPEDL